MNTPDITVDELAAAEHFNTRVLPELAALRYEVVNEEGFWRDYEDAAREKTVAELADALEVAGLEEESAGLPVMAYERGLKRDPLYPEAMAMAMSMLAESKSRTKSLADQDRDHDRRTAALVAGDPVTVLGYCVYANEVFKREVERRKQYAAEREAEEARDWMARFEFSELNAELDDMLDEWGLG